MALPGAIDPGIPIVALHDQILGILILKLIEWIPNISEGRDTRLIKELLDLPAATAGVQLLHTDSGFDAHRTVATFVGEPAAILEAAFVLVAAAAQLMDMHLHTGIHPRFGAVDVCPFVPLGDATMDDCVQLATKLGRRIGEELKLPVWLYGSAAKIPERENLRQIRRGEFEGLVERFASGELPDYGPAEVTNAGAVAIGARPLLIAFNIDLDTIDTSIAQAIAEQVRTSGWREQNTQGTWTRIEGQLPACLAIGWYVPEYKHVQVSMNLTDYAVTPPHVAYRAVQAEAAKLGAEVTGSELVGMIPLAAMLSAGRAFCLDQGRRAVEDRDELIDAAVAGLGLESHGPFSPRTRIIEFALESIGLSGN